MKHLVRRAGTLAMEVAVSECATADNSRAPFKGFNRAMFAFNDSWIRSRSSRRRRHTEK
jgi:ABC-type transporter lipoprotein component MlaA